MAQADSTHDTQRGEPKRVALIAALAAGEPWRKAGAMVGVSESTVARRMREPGFKAEVVAARAVLVEGVLGRLAAVAQRAVDTLDAALDAEHPAVRVSAARAIIENLVRVREQVELSERVAELEARLATRQAGVSRDAPGAEGDAA